MTKSAKFFVYIIFFIYPFLYSGSEFTLRMIDVDGVPVIFVNEREASPADLKMALKMIRSSTPNGRIRIYVDPSIAAGDLMPLLHEIKKAQISKVVIVTPLPAKGEGEYLNFQASISQSFVESVPKAIEEPENFEEKGPARKRRLKPVEHRE